MTTTLTPHGDGVALVIDQAILDSLQIKLDTPLDVTVRDGQLIITPVPADVAFRTALQQVNDRFQPALQRLAE